MKRKCLNDSSKASQNGSEKNGYKVTRHESTNTDWMPEVRQEKWIVVLAEGGILGK